MEYIDFDRSDKKIRGRKAVRKILIWIIELVLVIGLAYCIVNVALEKTTMMGFSMGDTIHDNDTVIINKAAYFFHKPERFDVVVYKQSGREHSYYTIKRIIGLPGETVQIKDGVVFIDGELLLEPINVEQMYVAGLAEDEIKLEAEEYFVLGDSRNNSEDSRFANVGNIVESDIIGLAWLRTVPEFAFISKQNLKSAEPEENESGENESEENELEE